MYQSFVHNENTHFLFHYVVQFIRLLLIHFSIIIFIYSIHWYIYMLCCCRCYCVCQHSYSQCMAGHVIPCMLIIICITGKILQIKYQKIHWFIKTAIRAINRSTVCRPCSNSNERMDVKHDGGIYSLWLDGEDITKGQKDIIKLNNNKKINKKIIIIVYLTDNVWWHQCGISESLVGA